jgi:phage shock protein A
MTEKQSIFGRITQLARANINALIDSAEDPQKMLDQLVRDYTNSIADAEKAIAQTIGNLRLAEQDYNEDVRASQEWGQKALAASARADQYRATGDAANADKFDNLAKVALGKQITAEQEVRDAEPIIASQRETVEKLKVGLATMKDKLGQLKQRRDTLVARQKSAQAQQTVQTAISSINVLDPTSELARFEDKVRREEALAMGQAEIAASSLDSQFAELEQSSASLEIEARLAALKSGSSAPAISATPVTPEIEPAPGPPPEPRDVPEGRDTDACRGPRPSGAGGRGTVPIP